MVMEAMRGVGLFHKLLPGGADWLAGWRVSQAGVVMSEYWVWLPGSGMEGCGVVEEVDVRWSRLPGFR